MTVNQLHRTLGRLIAQKRGRLRVVISKTTFAHPLEADGCTMLNVDNAEVCRYPALEGDGHTIINRDGYEREMCALVLTGEGGEG